MLTLASFEVLCLKKPLLHTWHFYPYTRHTSRGCLGVVSPWWAPSQNWLLRAERQSRNQCIYLACSWSWFDPQCHIGSPPVPPEMATERALPSLAQIPWKILRTHSWSCKVEQTHLIDHESVKVPGDTNTSEARNQSLRNWQPAAIAKQVCDQWLNINLVSTEVTLAAVPGGSGEKCKWVKKEIRET